MTYLAQFRQPRKHLNPLNVTFRAPIDVEIYSVGKRPKRWRAHIIGGTGKVDPICWEGGGPIDVPEAAGGAGNVKAAIKALFEEQLSEWVEILTEQEKYERDHPTPELSKKAIATPRDSYGMKGHA